MVKPQLMLEKPSLIQMVLLLLTHINQPIHGKLIFMTVEKLLELLLKMDKRQLILMID